MQRLITLAWLATISTACGNTHLNDQFSRRLSSNAEVCRVAPPSVQLTAANAPIRGLAGTFSTNEPLATSAPVNGSAVALMRLSIPIKKGDIVILRSQMQMSLENPDGSTPCATGQFWMEADGGRIGNRDTHNNVLGFSDGPAAGYPIHHMPYWSDGVYTAKADGNVMFVANFSASATCGAAPASVTLDQPHYGHIHARVFRGYPSIANAIANHALVLQNWAIDQDRRYLTFGVNHPYYAREGATAYQLNDLPSKAGDVYAVSGQTMTNWLLSGQGTPTNPDPVEMSAQGIIDLKNAGIVNPAQIQKSLAGSHGAENITPSNDITVHYSDALVTSDTSANQNFSLALWANFGRGAGIMESGFLGTLHYTALSSASQDHLYSLQGVTMRQGFLASVKSNGTQQMISSQTLNVGLGDVLHGVSFVVPQAAANGSSAYCESSLLVADAKSGKTLASSPVAGKRLSKWIGAVPLRPELYFTAKQEGGVLVKTMMRCTGSTGAAIALDDDGSLQFVEHYSLLPTKQAKPSPLPTVTSVAVRPTATTTPEVSPTPASTTTPESPTVAPPDPAPTAAAVPCGG